MAELALAGGTPVRNKEMISWPVHGTEEQTRVAEVISSGEWWWGENVREFESKFAAYHSAKHGITCNNGTVALILGLRAIGITAVFTDNRVAVSAKRQRPCCLTSATVKRP